MDVPDLDQLILENRRPPKDIPDPLPDDFYKEAVNSSPSTCSDDFNPAYRRPTGATFWKPLRPFKEGQGIRHVPDLDQLLLENMRPPKDIPDPLADDFYKETVNSSPSTSSNDSFPPFRRPTRDSATDATVKKILRESQGAIDKAALKLVAPSAVNVTGNQYHDLVKLSVDEAALVQTEEDAINASRKKANASVLHPR